MLFLSEFCYKQISKSEKGLEVRTPTPNRLRKKDLLNRSNLIIG